MDEHRKLHTAGLLAGNSSNRGILFWLVILVMLGLGRALVKRIVEVHGGRIWIESEGKGTTFLFTLANSPRQGTT